MKNFLDKFKNLIRKLLFHRSNKFEGSNLSHYSPLGRKLSLETREISSRTYTILRTSWKTLPPLTSRFLCVYLFIIIQDDKNSHLFNIIKYISKQRICIIFAFNYIAAWNKTDDKAVQRVQMSKFYTLRQKKRVVEEIKNKLGEVGFAGYSGALIGFLG